MAIASADPASGPRLRRTWPVPSPGMVVVGPWFRLVVVLLLASVTEALYLWFWVLSYYLTQAQDFTYEYLSQYRLVWDRLAPMLQRFEQAAPGVSSSLEPMVNLLEGALLVAFSLYLLAFVAVRRGLPSPWGTAVVVGAAIAFQATLFLMPGLFTTDMFSYVAYGLIAGAYGVSPFVYPPAAFPSAPILDWIHPLWHFAPSIYGPVWIDLGTLVGWKTAGASLVDQVLTYKLIVNVGHLVGIAALAIAVHRLRRGDTLASVLLYAWNPLILFEFGGNGHNDAVMVALMLIAFALLSFRERFVGCAVLTLSFLIKMSSVLAAPFYLMAIAAETRSVMRFCISGAVGLAVMGATVVAFYWPWWTGTETIGPIVNWTQGPLFNNYLPDYASQHIAYKHILGQSTLDPDIALDQARDWTRLLTKAGFALYCLAELLRVRGAVSAAAAGARVMLAFLLFVNTWVLPWYFTWPLALAILVGWQSPLTKMLVAFSISAPCVMYYKHFWHPYMSASTYTLFLLPLLVAPVVWLARWTLASWHARESPGLLALSEPSPLVSSPREPSA